MNSQEEFLPDREIGTRLRAARRELGLNQSQLAAVGGVKLNTQSRYESGDLPSLEYLLRIGTAGADWYWVLTGQRIGGQVLDDRTAQLVGAFTHLPSALQDEVLRHVNALRDFTSDQQAPD